MLVLRTSAPNVFLPFSLRTFIKHLSALRITTLPLCPRTALNAKTLTTTATAITAKIHCSSSFETLTSHQKQQIHLYVETLLQWNQRMNLTAVTEVDEVMERHIQDSLAIIPPIQSSYAPCCADSCDNISLVDVGSGAGLPGLVLAIASPGWKITVLDSMKKRCDFLEHAASVVGLSNVRVVRGRAEEIGVGSMLDLGRSSENETGQEIGRNPAFREIFDVAVARAVAEMRILAEYCLPLVRVGGLFVAAKGHDPEEEVRNAQRAIKLMGAAVMQQNSVESHGPHGQRTAIVCFKERCTPSDYPRVPGTPGKLPL